VTTRITRRFIHEQWGYSNSIKNIYYATFQLKNKSIDINTKLSIQNLKILEQITIIAYYRIFFYY